MKQEMPNLSLPALKILRVFLDCPKDELSGADIKRTSKIGSGTLYPILERLETAKWLYREWENANPSKLGRPRKRLYRMTEKGKRLASETMKSLGASA